MLRESTDDSLAAPQGGAGTLLIVMLWMRWFRELAEIDSLASERER